MKTKLLLCCISLLITANILSMSKDDWYVTLGNVKNKSTGMVTVKITKPGSRDSETQIIGPRQSWGFSQERFAQLVSLSTTAHKLAPNTSIDITVDTGAHKSVQRGLLIEKRTFDNNDVIDVKVDADHKITYKRKKWCAKNKCWCKFSETGPSELSQWITV